MVRMRDGDPQKQIDKGRLLRTLRRARELLRDPKRWSKHGLRTGFFDDRRFCAVGALYEVLELPMDAANFLDHPRCGQWFEARRALLVALRMVEGDLVVRERYLDEVGPWQDEERVQHHHVLGLYDWAIRVVEVTE